MKKQLTILTLFTSLVLVSCAPVYECGNKPKDPIRGGKRLKSTVAERDALCKDLAAEKQTTEALSIDKRNLKIELDQAFDARNLAEQARVKEYADKLKIQNDYDALLNQSTTEQGKLNRSLKEKEAELLKRERALREMKAIIDRQDSITNRLNSVIKNALLGFNSDELSVEIKNGKVYVSMSDKLLFKSGSADVEQKGQEAIKLLAEVLIKNPDVDVLVEGHTDNIPIKTAIYRDNWDLSVGRAASVVRLLTGNYKVSPKQVTPAGRGEFFPKGDNATPEGRAKNRRTEIILSPKLDELMNVLK